MYYVPQVANNDCGYACVKMLLADVHSDKNYLYVAIEERQENASFKELIDFAKKYHLTLEGYKVKEKDSITEMNQFPFIAQIKKSEKIYHAVIVTAVKKEKVYYIDPSFGKVSVSIGRFIEEWEGNLLIVKDFIKTPCDVPHYKPLNVKTRISIFILQIISAGSLIAGGYFINDETYVLYPILFIALFAVFEVIFRSYLFKVMENLDHDFVSYMPLKSKKWKPFYLHFEKLKQLSMVSPMNFIFYLLASLFLIVLMIFNSPTNLPLVGVAIGFAILETIIFKPYNLIKEKEIEDKETKLDEIDEYDDFTDYIREIHSDAYSYAKINLSKKILTIFVIFLTSLLSMYLSGISSITYVAFSVGATYLTYTYLCRLFNYEKDLEQYNKALIRVNNFISPRLLNNQTNGKKGKNKVFENE